MAVSHPLRAHTGGAGAGTLTEPLTRGEIEPQIEGRFRAFSVHQLTLAWWLHTSGHMTRRQLRVYFALNEMAERRNYTRAPEGRNARQRPLYRVEEVAVLVGGRGSPTALDELRADLRRLAALGLATFSPHQLTFAASADQVRVDDLSGFWAMFAQMRHQRRTVPVPRRTLRALAGGFSRAVTGVMLAMLIRSLFWHRTGSEGSGGVYRVDGRTKGSWIAEVFGLSRRAITDARATLIELGWIMPLEAPQWALNRWGNHDRINVEWCPARLADAPAQPTGPAARAVGGGSEATTTSAESASPSSVFRGDFARPCLNSSPSPRGNTNTRRLGGTAPGPAGVSLRNSLGSRRKKAAMRATREPNIRDIQPEHMRQTEDLLELYRQAVTIGLAKPSEAGRLDFLALAERARAHGKRAGALFYWLLREKKTVFITQADEDAAADRLRELHNGRRPREQWGGGSAGTPPLPPKPPALTDDEAFMLACERVARERGIEHPFILARTRDWTRERWDTTHAGYEAKRLAFIQASRGGQDQDSATA